VTDAHDPGNYLRKEIRRYDAEMQARLAELDGDGT
jgi:hypothetical protein